MDFISILKCDIIQVSERIKKLFQKEFKKAIADQNSAKNLPVPPTSSAISQPYAESAVSIIPSPPITESIMHTDNLRRNKDNNKDNYKDITSSSTCAATAPQVAKTRTSISNRAVAVTTSMQFLGYELKCNEILKALVRAHII